MEYESHKDLNTCDQAVTSCVQLVNYTSMCIHHLNPSEDFKLI